MCIVQDRGIGAAEAIKPQVAIVDIVTAGHLNLGLCKVYLCCLGHSDCTVAVQLLVEVEWPGLTNMSVRCAS